MDLTVLDTLRAVAARGLDTRLALPREPLGEEQWERFANHSTRASLWGEVSDAALSGDLPVTDEQLARTLTEHQRSMGTVLELEAQALDVVERLSGTGLDVVVLKGMASAHLDHPDPSRRVFNDIDLLAPPGSFAQAIGVLEGEGWQRDLPERRAGFDERFAKDSTMTRDGWVELDVHRTLANGPFGLWIDLDELWSGTQPLVIGGCELLALDGPGRLLNACYAAILGDAEPKLTSLRDIALMVQRRPQVLEEALGVADRWRGRLVVATALEVASEHLGLELSLGTERADRRERLALRSYRSLGGSNTALRLAALVALPGVADRAAYLSALALPSGPHRRARRRTGRPSEWRAGIREVIGPRSARPSRPR